jgi:hypothetical protein
MDILYGLLGKNEELIIIKTQIKQLNKDNKDLLKEIIQNEFNCSENDQLILSYEKSI